MVKDIYRITVISLIIYLIIQFAWLLIAKGIRGSITSAKNTYQAALNDSSNILASTPTLTSSILQTGKDGFIDSKTYNSAQDDDENIRSDFWNNSSNNLERLSVLESIISKKLVSTLGDRHWRDDVIQQISSINMDSISQEQIGSFIRKSSENWWIVKLAQKFSDFYTPNKSGVLANESLDHLSSIKTQSENQIIMVSVMPQNPAEYYSDETDKKYSTETHKH